MSAPSADSPGPQRLLDSRWLQKPGKQARDTALQQDELKASSGKMEQVCWLAIAASPSSDTGYPPCSITSECPVLLLSWTLSESHVSTACSYLAAMSDVCT